MSTDIKREMYKRLSLAMRKNDTTYYLKTRKEKKENEKRKTKTNNNVRIKKERNHDF
jgi:hypothetical protein